MLIWAGILSCSIGILRFWRPQKIMDFQTLQFYLKMQKIANYTKTEGFHSSLVTFGFVIRISTLKQYSTFSQLGYISQMGYTFIKMYPDWKMLTVLFTKMKKGKFCEKRGSCKRNLQKNNKFRKFWPKNFEIYRGKLKTFNFLFV